jgi:hypothetical protein
MSYYTLPADRINELREIADSLQCAQDLQALVMLYGLRSMQGADEDLLKVGEVTAEDMLDRAGCNLRAAEFLEDTLCKAEFAEICRANDLGDYSLEPTIVFKRRI